MSQKRVRLKPLSELQKKGYVYSYLPASGTYVLTDGFTFKSFNHDCFKSTFTVCEDDKTIGKEVYDQLKDCFVEVESDDSIN